MAKISVARASRPDEENPEWTQADFDKAQPASEILPGLIGETATQALLHRSGQPINPCKKVSQTLRLDADVLDAYKQEGSGWQTRMNQVLRENMPGNPK